MKRVALILAVGILGIVWAGTSAFAVDRTVLAKSQGDSNHFFEPETVTILEGDTVTWRNDSGTHNVVFKGSGEKLGGNPITHDPAAGDWEDSKTFPDAGTYRYYCSEHADPDNPDFGMWGKVVVKVPGGDTTPPKITNLRARPSAFCTNKSESCDKRGTKIKFTLSEKAKVKIQVRPDNGKTGRTIFHKQRSAGKHTIDFRGKDMKPGKYILRASARDAAGNNSTVATANIRVKKEG